MKWTAVEPWVVSQAIYIHIRWFGRPVAHNRVCYRMGGVTAMGSSAMNLDHCPATVPFHGFQVLLHRMYVSCMARRSSGVHSLVRSFSDLYSPKRGSRSTASW